MFTISTDSLEFSSHGYTIDINNEEFDLHHNKISIAFRKKYLNRVKQTQNNEPHTEFIVNSEHTKNSPLGIIRCFDILFDIILENPDTEHLIGQIANAYLRYTHKYSEEIENALKTESLFDCLYIYIFWNTEELLTKAISLVFNLTYLENSYWIQDIYNMSYSTLKDSNLMSSKIITKPARHYMSKSQYIFNVLYITCQIQYPEIYLNDPTINSMSIIVFGIPFNETHQVFKYAPDSFTEVKNKPKLNSESNDSNNDSDSSSSYKTNSKSSYESDSSSSFDYESYRENLRNIRPFIAATNKKLGPCIQIFPMRRQNINQTKHKIQKM